MRRLLIALVLALSLSAVNAETLKVVWGMVDYNGEEFTSGDIAFVRFRAWLERGTGPEIVVGEISTQNDPGNSVEMYYSIRGVSILDLSNFTSWGPGNRIYMDIGDQPGGSVLYGQAEWTITDTTEELIELGFEDFGLTGTGDPTYVYYISGISDEILPLNTELFQNYPNPFNPVTQIKFALAKTADVKLSVYNIAGQKVAELANGSRQAGVHAVDFQGSRLNSGIYYYTLEVGDMAMTKKMLMIK